MMVIFFQHFIYFVSFQVEGKITSESVTAEVAVYDVGEQCTSSRAPSGVQIKRSAV